MITNFRPRHARSVAFLQKELARQATTDDAALMRMEIRSSDCRRDDARSRFAAKFGRSLEREIRQMIDLYGWRRVASFVMIDFSDRLLSLAMADEYDQTGEWLHGEDLRSEKSDRMVALQPLVAAPLRGRMEHMGMLDDGSFKS